MKIQITLEYLGARFSGWQFQPNVETVQGNLEQALATYLESLAKRQRQEFLGRVSIIGSGRTDAGVHARGQVASFAWPAELELNLHDLRSALNGLSAAEIEVRDISVQDDSFDARRSPHLKRYSYLIRLSNERGALREGRAWSLGTKLNIPVMIKGARIFSGTHDFSGFRASDCAAASTVRSITRSELTRVAADELVYTIEGNGFLKQMVRIIVGTLAELGRSRLSLADIEQALILGKRELSGPTAPAQGLTLEWVRYI